ncbi:MAG: type II/IV secretion system ATPase subunit [Candidatus Aenigmatarchaeota archaeon]
MFSVEVKDDILILTPTQVGIFYTIEDYPEVMSFVISTLSEKEYVNRITIRGVREIEYGPEEVKILKEIAEIYRFAVSELGAYRLNFYPKYREITKNILNLLLSDAIQCYVKIISELKKCEDRGYKEEFLKVLKEKLEKTKIVSYAISNKNFSVWVSGREIYRKIFNPLIKPYFMSTKFTLLPPPNSVLEERYYLKDGTKVEIYSSTVGTKVYYYIFMKEFLISEEENTVLEESKKRLGSLEIGTEYNFEVLRKVVKEKIEKIMKEVISQKDINISTSQINNLIEILLRHTVGFGVLEVLLQDDKIQDIYVNAPIGSSPVFINHSDYGECETNISLTIEEAESWASKLRLYSGRPLDEANPVLDAELFLPFGRARVAAITRTLSQSGLAFAFRRHRDSAWTFPLFLKSKYFNPLFAGLLNFIINGGRSILIAGGRGSGKTSLLSSMILELPRKYRIIVLEDTPELPIDVYKNLGYNIQHLKCRSVITHVETELAPEEALRTALRLGDSVLIVGEVRSRESTVLFEAMRVGALANLVAGTIHAESAYGVYDRVVNDLGLVSTSFKALDIIVIANMLKTPDGIRRFRRVIEVVEVRKKWKEDPWKEGAFVPLMVYSAKEDTLKPTETLLNGESEILNEISKRVKEWQGNWDKVWENILLRGKIKQTMLEFAEKYNRMDILEADRVIEANEMFYSLMEKSLMEKGFLDNNYVYEKWLEWFKEGLKR